MNAALVIGDPLTIELVGSYYKFFFKCITSFVQRIKLIFSVLR